MPLQTSSTQERERDIRREGSTETRNLATYQNPILAELRGRVVRILASADMPGHSPVCQYVDSQGRLSWEEQDQFTIIDLKFLPPSQDQLRDVLKQVSR